MRYAVGTVLYIVGSFFIISNEKKSKGIDEKTKSLKEIIIGTSLGIFNIFCCGLVITVNKILVKVPIGTQMLYVGIAISTYSFIITTFLRNVCLKPGYLVMCLFHGLFFYLGNFL